MKTFGELKAKYPRLIPPRFGFQCDVGWLRILDDYFAVVDREMPSDANYELRQVKEKLGALRIYDYGHATDNPRIQEAHRLAEARSFYTCEYCGKPGVWSNRAGVLLTVCEEHADDPDFGIAAPVESGAYMYSDNAGDWHRYDPDADTFLPSEAPKWPE